ncbi:MAG: magnesium transporter [Gemmatimonadaceae bacterium]|jgi:magnesium transporter|nr:magnesium transporter [Gemmatimonadaceae bacterium]
MAPPRRDDDLPIAALLAPDIMALLDEAPHEVAEETEEMHPADLADVAAAIPRERVVDLLLALGPDRAADVLEYLDEELRSEALESMSARQAAQLVSAMTPDDRADVLDELEEDVADEILSAIPVEARQETERLLAYEPDTAGGLMTTEFVSVPQAQRVEEALASVRAMARSGRKEAMYTIYATDADGRVVGVLSLRELLAAAEGTTVGELAWSEVVTVPATAKREEIAQVTAKYDLVAVPVVDEQQRVLGVVTVDDVIDIIQEQQTEDVQRLGGMEALDDPYMQTGFFTLLRKRAGWLTVLFIGELLTAVAMGHFEHEIARAAVLALFIPLIISSGGNSGSQATSLLIRALALRELRLRDWWKVAMRELPSGLLLGTILGTLGLVRVELWQALGLYDHGPHHLLIGFTVAGSLIGVVTFGTIVGAMLPFILKRFGLDPASASAPLVATLVDVTGLLIYFSLALLLLSGTLL